MAARRDIRKLVLIAILLAPISFAVSSGIVSAIEFLFAHTLPEGGWRSVEDGITVGAMIYGLTVAPLLENLLLLGALLVVKRLIVSDVMTSLITALLAASAHMLLSGQLAYAAVIPGFFVMSMLALSPQKRSEGYWISVVHHIAINSLSVASILMRHA